MKGQMLKCQWWLHGSLVCTICYTCASQRYVLSIGVYYLIFFKLPCVHYLPTAGAFYDKLKIQTKLCLISTEILSVHSPSVTHSNLTTDQVTKWVKLPKWSGFLDLSKTPDATVPCIRSMCWQFQAQNTDLPDLYTATHTLHYWDLNQTWNHSIWLVQTQYQEIYWVWTPYTRQDTLSSDHPGSLQPEQSHSVLTHTHT